MFQQLCDAQQCSGKLPSQCQKFIATLFAFKYKLLEQAQTRDDHNVSWPCSAPRLTQFCSKCPLHLHILFLSFYTKLYILEFVNNKKNKQLSLHPFYFLGLFLMVRQKWNLSSNELKASALLHLYIFYGGWSVRACLRERKLLPSPQLGLLGADWL